MVKSISTNKVLLITFKILGIYFEKLEIKIALFCQFHRKIQVCRSQLMFINMMGKSNEISPLPPSVTIAREKYSLQPQVKVAKKNFPFATKTDGCKKTNFMGFFHEYGILNTNFGKV